MNNNYILAYIQQPKTGLTIGGLDNALLTFENTKIKNLMAAINAAILQVFINA